jgi:hypothetical protein
MAALQCSNFPLYQRGGTSVLICVDTYGEGNTHMSKPNGFSLANSEKA